MVFYLQITIIINLENLFIKIVLVFLKKVINAEIYVVAALIIILFVLVNLKYFIFDELLLNMIFGIVLFLGFMIVSPKLMDESSNI